MNEYEMPVITQEQQAELIKFNRAIIAQYEAYAASEADWPDDVRLLVLSARIALASLTAETDYVRYSCGCCGYESLSYKHICPKCNHHTLRADKLYTAPPAPVLKPIELPEALLPANHKSGEAFMAADSQGNYINREFTIKAIRAAGYEVKL